MDKIIKVYLLCVIIVIGFLDLGLNIIALLPVVGPIGETGSEVVLEIIQVTSAGVITFVRFQKGTGKAKHPKMFAFCGFVVLGVLDVFGNVLSFIPVAGPFLETGTEAIAELLQIALAVILIL